MLAAKCWKSFGRESSLVPPRHIVALRSDDDDPAKVAFMDDLKSKRMARERAECEQ